MSGGGSNLDLSDLYKTMYEVKGILPDVLAAQNPVLLFNMINSIADEQRAEAEEDLPPSLGWMAGL